MDRLLVRFALVAFAIVTSSALAAQINLWNQSDLSIFSFYSAKWRGEEASDAFEALEAAFDAQRPSRQESGGKVGLNPEQAKLLEDSFSRYRVARADNQRFGKSVLYVFLMAFLLLVIVPVSRRVFPGNLIDRFVNELDRGRVGLNLDVLPADERSIVMQRLGVIRWYLNQITPLLKQLPKKALTKNDPLARMAAALREMPVVFSASGIPQVEPSESAQTRVGRLKQSLIEDRRRFEAEMASRREAFGEEVTAAVRREAEHDQEALRLKRDALQKLGEEVRGLEQRRVEASEALRRAEETIREAEQAGQRLGVREAAVQRREGDVQRSLHEVRRLTTENAQLVVRVDAGCVFMGERLAAYLAQHTDVAARVLATLSAPVNTAETA